MYSVLYGENWLVLVIKNNKFKKEKTFSTVRLLTIYLPKTKVLDYLIKVNCNNYLNTSINYNTDTGLDVVFDLFPRPEYTITLCAQPRSIVYTVHV